MGGEVKDVGPILIIHFNVFMVSVVKNSEGKVVDGDQVFYFFIIHLIYSFFQNTPVKLVNIWALCRDLENYNPATAWRVADIAFSKQNIPI
jgi:hypothetical protein